MSRAGVICEFNPFHNGHKFLIEKIKEQYADEVVCIMSGNFVQRGDIAITDKYTRAKTALRYGADIVVEMPTAYAVSGAQTFADNGVQLAAAMNCDMLCFGAESELPALMQLSDRLESEDVNRKIQALMKDGLYYPKALSQAVGESYAAIIEKPNNILALEYIRACKVYGIEPIAIKRIGVGHDDEDISGNYASASMIRKRILTGDDCAAFTPMTIASPCSLEKIESAILYRLKTVTPEELNRIADVSEGIEYRISDAAKKYNSIVEICEAIKTKRYTMARIRRIIIAAFLNITAEIQTTPVPYLRILGVKSDMQGLLRGAKLPLIVKTKADHDMLDNYAKKVFDIDLRAAEAINIAGNQMLNEFTQPVIKV